MGFSLGNLQRTLKRDVKCEYSKITTVGSLIFISPTGLIIGPPREVFKTIAYSDKSQFNFLVKQNKIECFHLILTC